MCLATKTDRSIIIVAGGCDHSATKLATRSDESIVAVGGCNHVLSHKIRQKYHHSGCRVQPCWAMKSDKSITVAAGGCNYVLGHKIL